MLQVRFFDTVNYAICVLCTPHYIGVLPGGVYMYLRAILSAERDDLFSAQFASVDDEVLAVTVMACCGSA